MADTGRAVIGASYGGGGEVVQIRCRAAARLSQQRLRIDANILRPLGDQVLQLFPLAAVERTRSLLEARPIAAMVGDESIGCVAPRFGRGRRLARFDDQATDRCR